MKNPIQQIEDLLNKFEQECLDSNVNSNVKYSPNEKSQDNNKIIALDTKIKNIIREGYGQYVSTSYGFFKYCADTSTYPLSFEIEIKLLEKNNDDNFRLPLDQLIESNKDIIITSSNRGNDTYDYIWNKVKFFRDYGLDMSYGQYIIMKPNDVCDKIKEHIKNNEHYEK